jgi:NAD(P)H-flavin reductase
VATDPLNNLLKESRFDQIYTCGPEEMIKKVYYIAKAANKITYSSKPRKIHKVQHKPMRLLRHRKIPCLQRRTRIRRKTAEGY